MVTLMQCVNPSCELLFLKNITYPHYKKEMPLLSVLVEFWGDCSPFAHPSLGSSSACLCIALCSERLILWTPLPSGFH